jgi:hypothetical protein
MTSAPERTSAPDWRTRIGAVAEEVLALIATIVVVIVSGGRPLFTARWHYMGYPLAALYAVIAVGETYHRIRKYRFRRRVRRFEEAQAIAARAHDQRA